MEISTGSKFNWWKVAFIVTLIAFEVAREIAVIEGSAPARPISSNLIYSFDGYVHAEGSWGRIDGGDVLVPSTVAIECDRATGQCIEASTMMHERYVYAPDISRFSAVFTSDGVSYENTNAECASYAVRIDLQMKKAFSVRSRKENPQNAECSKLEPRIEMQLTDGVKLYDDSAKGHFVPILSILKTIFN